MGRIFSIKININSCILFKMVARSLLRANNTQKRNVDMQGRQKSED